MRYEKDFEDFIKSLNKNKVKYCIIGAFAVGLYGYPRYTGDIDILVEPAPGNAEKIIKAIKEFGFKSLDLTEKDFSQENKVIQLGYEPVRIDLITSLGGITFKEIWKHKEEGTYGKVKVYFIGRNELIKSKKLANRPQDKIDIDKLFKRRN